MLMIYIDKFFVIDHDKTFYTLLLVYFKLSSNPDSFNRCFEGENLNISVARYIWCVNQSRFILFLLEILPQLDYYSLTSKASKLFLRLIWS